MKRNLWKTELRTEKRTEAIKALATFGANGYGKEAAEAILEVAGQYDWESIGDNKAIEPLQKARLCREGGLGGSWMLASAHFAPSMLGGRLIASSFPRRQLGHPKTKAVSHLCAATDTGFRIGRHSTEAVER